MRLSVLLLGHESFVGRPDLLYGGVQQLSTNYRQVPGLVRKPQKDSHGFSLEPSSELSPVVVKTKAEVTEKLTGAYWLRNAFKKNRSGFGSRSGSGTVDVVPYLIKRFQRAAGDGVGGAPAQSPHKPSGSDILESASLRPSGNQKSFMQSFKSADGWETHLAVLRESQAYTSAIENAARESARVLVTSTLNVQPDGKNHVSAPRSASAPGSGAGPASAPGSGAGPAASSSASSVSAGVGFAVQIILEGRGVRALFEPAWPNLVFRLGSGGLVVNMTKDCASASRQGVRGEIVNKDGTLVVVSGPEQKSVSSLVSKILRETRMNSYSHKGAHAAFNPFKKLKARKKR